MSVETLKINKYIQNYNNWLSNVIRKIYTEPTWTKKNTVRRQNEE